MLRSADLLNFLCISVILAEIVVSVFTEYKCSINSIAAISRLVTDPGSDLFSDH
jgi:hypothetical protein